jgi:ATP-dependent Zn protease
MVWHDDADVETGSRRAPRRETVGMICEAIAPLMPPPFDDRSAIAKELLHAGHQVISHLAGQIAEDIFIGERLEHTEHDVQDARAIAALVCRSSSAIDAYLDFCAAEANALLREHAAMVHAIADGLVERRTLSRSDMDRLLGAARRAL